MLKDNKYKKIIIITMLIVAAIAIAVLFATGKLDNFLSSPSESNYSSETGIYSSDDRSSTNNNDEINKSSTISNPESSGNTSSATSTGSSSSKPESSGSESSASEPQLKFRSKKLLNEHYQKHGIDMGFVSAEEYEQAAARVPYDPNVLHKTEAEDGDDVYYIESTNEFVVVSKDGYLRTYFNPDRGIDYFNRQ